jgi:II/X family phage/plasmid replication protein
MVVSESMTMIDWVSGRVSLSFSGLINAGEVVSLDADGGIEWRSPKRRQVEGSYSSSVSVRGGYGVLEFSGNPTKFLQGHNLFGPDNLLLLTERMLLVITEKLGITLSAADLAMLRAGDYDLSRVDVTRMLDCGGPERVRKTVDVLGQVVKTKYMSRSVVGSGTVYAGQKSRRLTWKFYDKSAELRAKGHGLCAKLAPRWHHALYDWCAGKLRAELTLRSLELADRGLRRASGWIPGMAETVYNSLIGAVEMNDSVRLTEDVVMNLPPRLVPIYHAWRAGTDFRALYSRTHFYRLRRQLLDLAGIDIARVQPRVVVTETEYIGGFPIGPLLRGPGSPVPDWARGTELLVS